LTIWQPDLVLCWRSCAISVASLLFCAGAVWADPPESSGPPQPEIVTREAWHALPPNTDLMQEQKPAEIVIHHTGQRQQRKISLEVKMRGLQNFSMRPGRSKPVWGDVPYHYYIDVSGRIGEGRDVSYAGDSIASDDTGDQIQIAVEGQFNKEQPTEAELDSLRKLVVWLAAMYGIPPEKITGHNEHGQTESPGRNLISFLPELKAAVKAE
jgi:hypothetical protein